MPVQRTLALFLLVAYALLSTAGVSWVICLGDSGHAGVEMLGATCCSESEEPPPCCPTEAPVQNEHDHDEDCGDCEDRALTSLLLSRQADDDEGPNDVPTPTMCAMVATAPAFRSCRATGRLLVPPDRPPPQRAPRSTTILLL